MLIYRKLYKKQILSCYEAIFIELEQIKTLIILKLIEISK